MDSFPSTVAGEQERLLPESFIGKSKVAKWVARIDIICHNGGEGMLKSQSQSDDDEMLS